MNSCSAFRRGWEPGAPDDHLAGCPGCGEWVAGQRRAQSALAHLAAAFDRSAMPAERELELRVAFRQAQRPAPARRVAPWVWGLATAAACVAAVVLALPRAATIGRERPIVDGAAAQNPPRAGTPVRPAPRSVGPAPARSARVPPTAPTHPNAAAPAPPPAVVEQAAIPPSTSVAEAPDAFARAAAVAPAVTASVSEPQGGAEAPPLAADERGFHPLPGAEAGEMDSGQIVRVQLRADVLDAAGLTPRAGSKGPVEAEVLVGPDGVARGIRLARPRR